MIKFILKKTLAVLTIMVVLSGCKNIISTAGGFSMLNNGYTNNSDGWISKITRHVYTSDLEKAENPGLITVFKKNTTPIQNDALPNNYNHIDYNSVKLPEAYSEINKSSRKSALKVHDWIVCKSQFTRVHSEGYSRDMHLAEILF